MKAFGVPLIFSFTIEEVLVFLPTVWLKELAEGGQAYL
jgi:hypothetical protein